MAMSYSIADDCAGCGTCARKCPENAISGEIKQRFDIDPDLCSECGTCFKTCPRGSVIDPEGNRSAKKVKKQKAVKARIDSDLCAGCRTCFMNCPHEAITVIKKTFFSSLYCQVDLEICVGCGICTEHCITGAVKLS